MKSIALFTAVLRMILVTAIISFTITANAQNVAINTTGSAADASAMLDVSSTSKGFLAPRMTTIQRTGISAPANGLMVFDIDTKTYWYFSDIWKEIINGGSESFTLPYSGSFAHPEKLFAITNTSASISRVAIYGKGSNFFSGLIPTSPTGVWGEEDQGIGVMGTSSGLYGVYGRSTQSHGVYGSTAGTYAAIYGKSTNSQGMGVMGYMPNGGTAVYGENDGSQGNAGKFVITNPGNNSNSLEIYTYGIGRAIGANIANSNSAAEVASIWTNGLGEALNASVLNSTSTANVLRLSTLGKGDPLYISSLHTSSNSYLIKGEHSGLGGGISLSITNESSLGDGIKVMNMGHGSGIRAFSKSAVAGVFSNSNVYSSILGLNMGLGRVGEFLIDNANNDKEVLLASTNGTGPGLVVNNTNTTTNTLNSLATFKKNNVNKVRIDGAGKGFFNGGTQSGGADLAEAFDVVGDRNEYEAGDVLVISVNRDRAVTKSDGAYSSLVAGVYATKPGVLLTEEDIEADLSDKVPMGVVGVIPTKVCLEGGEIKRGDLLVTSSISGVAMKGDVEKIKPGQVIGKALEIFTSLSTEKIKVLVNVK